MGLGASKHGVKTLNGFKPGDLKRASPRMKAELVIAVLAGAISGYYIYSPSLKEVTDKYRNTALPAQSKSASSSAKQDATQSNSITAENKDHAEDR